MSTKKLPQIPVGLKWLWHLSGIPHLSGPLAKQTGWFCLPTTTKSWIELCGMAQELRGDLPQSILLGLQGTPSPDEVLNSNSKAQEAGHTAPEIA